MFKNTFLITLLSSKSYKISGTIKDKQNKPLITTVYIYENETLLKSTNSSSTGIFEFDQIKAGLYKIKITLSGYANYEAIHDIFENTTLNIVLAGYATVSGTIKNALTNTVMSGAKIEFIKDNVIRYLTTTNSSGYYSISGIGQETYILKISSEGFITYEQSHEILQASYTVSVQLSPKLKDNEWIRLILSWGASPRDLDFHIRKPNGTIVFYGNKTDASLQLDQDVTGGYGPETMTIFNTADIGTYLIYIKNFSFSSQPDFTSSAAKIVGYASDGKIFSWDIPKTNNAQYWYVCRITLNSNRTFTITTVNQLISYEPT